MGCNCGSGRSARVTWTHCKPDGACKTYSTEIEAEAAKTRFGGTQYPFTDAHCRLGVFHLKLFLRCGFASRVATFTRAKLCMLGRLSATNLIFVITLHLGTSRNA